MAISKYTRFGLRADFNLADLLDPNAALTNILDDFIENKTFLPGDLTVINGLQSTNIFASDFATLANSEVTYTPVVTDQQGNISLSTEKVVVQPLVRIHDLVQGRRVVTGNPPYKFGGTGPDATIIPSNGLKPLAAQLSHSSTITANDVFDTTNQSGVNIVGEDYWLDGRFAFSDALYPTFGDAYGGLSWEGHLSNPEPKGIHIRTNAFFLFEKYNTDTSAWETVKQVSEQSFTVTANGTDAVGRVEEIPIVTTDMLHVCAGMTLTIADGSKFEIIVTRSSSIDVEHRSGPTTTVIYTPSTTFTIDWNIGIPDTINTRGLSVGNMLPGETKRVRLTAWYPEPTSFSPALSRVSYSPFHLEVDMDDDGNFAVGTPFTRFYKQSQGGPSYTPPVYTYEHFKRNHINEYNRRTPFYIQNEKPVYMTYLPKLLTKDISRYNNGSNLPELKNFTWNGGNTFRGSSDDVTAVKKGDILLFSGYQTVDGTFDASDGHYYLQVVDKSGPYVYVNGYVGNDMDAIMTHYGKSIGSSIGFYVIDPKGLISIFTQTLDSGSQTAAGGQDIFTCQPLLNTNNDYNAEDIVIGDLIVHFNDTTGREKFRKISNITTGNTTAPTAIVTQAIDQNEQHELFDGGIVLVYAHRGLTDLSTKAQCVGTYGREVTALATSGANQIQIDSTEGIVTGSAGTADYVQLSTAIPANTHVVSSNATHITLSNNITADVNPAATLVFIPPATAQVANYGPLEFCILPLNTAPPFAGTDLGLETITNFPHLVVNGKFKITGLEISNTTSTSVTTPTTSTANSGLLLRKPTTQSSWDSFDDYYILMK